MQSSRVAAIALALGLAACGSSSKPAPTGPAAGSALADPAATPTIALLGLGEIQMKSDGKLVMAVHANGDVEFGLPDGTTMPIGKLGATGTFTTSDGKSAVLHADGTLTSPDGPAPFKLVGASLVAGTTTVTIENGKLVGANGSDAGNVTITGADTDPTKRTALLMLGLLMSARASAEAPATAGSAVPAPAPAGH